MAAEPLTKTLMIRAAAMALCLSGETAADMAGVPTRAFVATTRKTWRANGYTFSDADIRAIHFELRRLVGVWRAPTSIETVQ